jgi:flavin-dependent dehydrogenase
MVGQSIVSGLKKSYDAVVVGSGPAGASIAKTLYGSGLDVVILEKCSLPRDKVCSGVVLPSARKFLCDNYPDIPKNVFAEPPEIKGGRYIRTSESQYREMSVLATDVGKDLPACGFNIYRRELDLWLCRESRAPIADNCLFVDYSDEREGISARVKHNGERLTIKTKYLIGVDGPISRVRRSLLPEYDKTLHWIAVRDEFYEGEVDLEPGWIYWILDTGMTTGMASLIHKDRYIQLSVGSSPEESPNKLLKRFVAILTDKYGLHINKTTIRHGIVMNDMPYREDYVLGNGNVLLAGEAAGFVRGLDGITSALVTGKAAGESILESARSGRSPLAHYSDHELVVSEKEICKEAHRKMSNLGLGGP